MNQFTQWCRNQWAMLNLGGVWIVPRSGLSFRKTSDGFKLADVAQPVTKSFRQYQREDFSEIARQFSEAGLKISDPAGLIGGAQ